jgi:hypothetical protein
MVLSTPLKNKKTAVIFPMSCSGSSKGLPSQSMPTEWIDLKAAGTKGYSATAEVPFIEQNTCNYR